MDLSVLGKSSLFAGVPSEELENILITISHQIQSYEKGETVFFMMGEACLAGVILTGHIQAQKAFPNGSQVNVSLFEPGDIIGAAAIFSANQKYPCDLVASEPSSVILFRKTDLIGLMQTDSRILENLMSEVASAAYMLQQRLELFSYSGIAQKAAFWLLTQARQTETNQVRIPKSISRWAMMMNVSRPSLHRELKKLEEQGMISYSPPFIQINAPEKLQGVLGKS